MKKLLYLITFIYSISVVSQTKVSGHIFDENNEPVSFSNVVFKGSSIGTITNENGKFYLESNETWDTLIISFIGYETLEIQLDKKVNYNLEFTLKEEASQLGTVLIVSGKQPKNEAENPAIAILKKIWKHKRKNGLKQFKQS